MKKLLFSVIFIFLAFCTFATDYYISADGNDSNSGTSPGAPWQTTNKLNAYFRNLRPGDRVLFRRGDTFYGGITINSNGRAGAPITIGAYGSGEKPVITGFTSVSSWNHLGGNIWESVQSVSGLPSANMVTVNGVSTPMGRWPNSTAPNSGYLTIKDVSGSSSLTSDGLSGSQNWNGASIVIRKERWAIERGTVTSHSGGRVSYKNENVYPAKKGYGFFIQDHPNTLDMEGEWYYNPSNGKIRIYSRTMPRDVKVASVDNLIFAKGNSYITIENLDIRGANADAVNCFNYGKYVVIQNCDISFAGKTGIYTEVSNVTIERNNVSYVNYNGIVAVERSAKIQGNNVKAVDVFEGMGQTLASAGIRTIAENSVIQSNRVDSTGYMGIIFHGRNTLVKNNFVNAFCFVKDDGAGIAMTARDRAKGSIIDGNIILNGIGAKAGAPGASTDASGIMIDAWGTGITITNNTVAHNSNIGIKIHGANDIIIRGNTAYDNGGADWSKGGMEFLSSAGYLIRNISMQENIFFAKTHQQVAFFGYPASTSPHDMKLFGNADNNYYAKPIDPEKAIVVGSTFYSVEGWKSYSGKDASSKSAPKKINDTKELRFEYNASAESKTVALDAVYVDVKNKTYNGSITLAPYASAVLIRKGDLANTPPEVSVGPDQSIGLPVNTVSLSSSANASKGSKLSYSWSKQSGPAGGNIADAKSPTTDITDLLEGVYFFELVVTDENGVSSSATVKITVKPEEKLLPAVKPSNLVSGLNYDYYEATGLTSVPDFSKMSAVQSGTVPTFDLSMAGREEVFAVQFSGYIDVPEDGEYTFSVTSDDGSKLYIDGVLIVDNDGLHGAVEKSGKIALQAGKHAISVGYFQQYGGKTLRVNYSGPGVDFQPIPASALYSLGTETVLLPAVNPSNIVSGITYDYYEGSNFTNVPDFSRLSPLKSGLTSNFDASVADRAEVFALEFKGFVDIPADGEYTFYTKSDDGSLLYIDDVLVVNNDGLHGALERSGTIGLKAGKHKISVGYFQQYGGKTLEVSYSAPNFSKRAIPNSSLYSHSANEALLSAVNPSNTIAGISYEYYEGPAYSAVPDFTKLTPVKSGSLPNFNLSMADRSEVFAVQFKGFINVPGDGQYTFYTTSDDGSLLYIDDMLVVNNDGLHGALENSGTIGLKAGKHAITVGYFQQFGNKTLEVSYEGPGFVKQPILSSALSFSAELTKDPGFGFAGRNALASNSVLKGQSIPEFEVGVKAYPNPFVHSVNVSINGKAGSYEMILTDVLGRTLWTRSGNKGDGIFQETINTSSIQRGVYFLKVIQDKQTEVIKLEK